MKKTLFGIIILTLLLSGCSKYGSKIVVTAASEDEGGTNSISGIVTLPDDTPKGLVYYITYHESKYVSISNYFSEGSKSPAKTGQKKTIMYKINGLPDGDYYISLGVNNEGKDWDDADKGYLIGFYTDGDEVVKSLDAATMVSVSGGEAKTDINFKVGLK